MSEKEKRFEKALREIALYGEGVKEETRDWKNITLGMKRIAREAFAGKCKTCGKAKNFK